MFRVKIRYVTDSGFYNYDPELEKEIDDFLKVNPVFKKEVIQSDSDGREIDFSVDLKDEMELAALVVLLADIIDGKFTSSVEFCQWSWSSLEDKFFDTPQVLTEGSEDYNVVDFN